MNDKCELEVVNYQEDFMSEVNAKRIKEAEGDLLIGDGNPVWLLNLFTSIAGSADALERGLLGVLYIIMFESGFYFMDGPHNATISYDIQVMCSLKDAKILLKHMKKEDFYSTVFSHNLIYPEPLKIIAYSIMNCNFSTNPVLVVNFFLPKDNEIKTFVLPTNKYISMENNKMKLLDSKAELNITLKNFLYSVKNSISDGIYYPHHILSLPLHILQNLCLYLKGKSFIKLIMTCKFLYESFSDDETLWKYHSLNDFRGLNKLSNETWKDHYKYQAIKIEEENSSEKNDDEVQSSDVATDNHRTMPTSSTQAEETNAKDGFSNNSRKKVNGAGLRTNSLGSATPPIERKSKFSAFGRLFKPWKWKRKKKSEKFEATSRSLERKISVRAPREELVQKGILLLDSPTSPLPASLPVFESTPLVCIQPIHPIQVTPPQFQLPPISAPSPQANDLKKEKSDEGKAVESDTGSKPERPSSLGPPNLTRRLLSYHNDFTSPTLPNPHESGGGGDSGKESPPPGDCTDTPLTLSELPEPPIPLSEIGPIPPPPMFSSHPADLPEFSYQDCQDPGDYSDEEGSDCDTESLRLPAPNPTIDTSRVEEIPAKEPKFHAMPLKSALKKPPTPTQESPQPQYKAVQLVARPVRFGLSLSLENKENTRPGDESEGSDSSGDGPVLYRDDDAESRLAAKIARKDSLALKLALRPDRQELIDRNILQVQSEKERQETKEAVGARLIRRLSMRPTQEELEDRNILKKQTAAEEKKLKEEKKRMLLRKLSFRPTVEELKEKKIIRFNDYIEVTQAHDYDRRADKPWTRLTPKDKAAIRKELNEFKSSEMEVHQESRHLTRFHRP